jgi:hypothetical protein
LLYPAELQAQALVPGFLPPGNCHQFPLTFKDYITLLLICPEQNPIFFIILGKQNVNSQILCAHPAFFHPDARI